MPHRNLTVQQIARAIGATVEGDPKAVVSSAASLEHAQPGQITFAIDARRQAPLSACRATAAVVGAGLKAPEGMCVLRVEDPEAAFAHVLGMLAPLEDLPAVGVWPSACVAEDAELGREVAIGPNAYVGPGAVIGDNAVLCANVHVGAGTVIGDATVLFPGVVVHQRCRVGRRCRVHANSVIGADGFGYYFRGGVHHKVPHVGTVEVGDDVEIGACSCIDRAKFGVTRIGDGTKIDNLVQVAHNVQVGRGVLLVAQVGVAGSTSLGDYVVLGGHVGVRDHVTVASGVRAAAFSAIAQDVEEPQEISGIPAIPAREHFRILQMQQRLPEMRRQIKELQARLDALERSATDNQA